MYFFNKKFITYLALLVSFCFILISCETTLNQEDIAKEYQHSSIQGFVKARYVYEREAKIDNVFDKISPHHPKTIEDYVDKLLLDGKSVIYPAAFTEVNDKLLYKPVIEMIEFCHVQHGQLTLKHKFEPYLQGVYENPTENYFHTLAANIPKSIDIPNLGAIALGEYSEMNVTIDKQSLARAVAKQTVLENTSTISQIYQVAAKLGAFGVYSCRKIKARAIIWGVVIKPIAFQAKNHSDSLDTNRLFLLISPVSR